LFQFIGISGVFAGTYLGYSDYQIVTDFRFPAEPYFRKMSESGVNFQRIWVLGYSGVEKKFDELLPFVIENDTYRLDQIEPRYIERLKNVLALAEKHHQRVMLTLFDNWSLGSVFPRTPWYYKNNGQRLQLNGRKDFYSVRNRKLIRLQENYVRRIVAATRDFLPIYEIVNEGGGANCEQLGEWHQSVASWIQSEFPEAEIAVNTSSDCPQVLDAPWVKVISFHHSSWSRNGICSYVEKYPDKEIILDTDGGWRFRDDNKLVKSWLSEAMSCGASFNHKDDIYKLDLELLNVYQDFKNRTK